MIDLTLEIPVSNKDHPLVDLPIYGPKMVKAVVVGIYESGMVDAKVIKAAYHYHENDRLVWPPEHITIRRAE